MAKVELQDISDIIGKSKETIKPVVELEDENFKETEVDNLNVVESFEETEEVAKEMDMEKEEAEKMVEAETAVDESVNINPEPEEIKEEETKPVRKYVSDADLIAYEPSEEDDAPGIKCTYADMAKACGGYCTVCNKKCNGEVKARGTTFFVTDECNACLYTGGKVKIVKIPKSVIMALLNDSKMVLASSNPNVSNIASDKTIYDMGIIIDKEL